MEIRDERQLAFLQIKQNAVNLNYAENYLFFPGDPITVWEIFELRGNALESLCGMTAVLHRSLF